MSGSRELTGSTGVKLAVLDYLWRYKWLSIPLFCLLLASRFVSGRDVFTGGRSTDATFLKPARAVRKSWWSDKRGISRAAVRFTVIAALWALTVVPVVVCILLGLECVVLALVAVRKYRERQYEKKVLLPIWPAIAGIIGIPDTQPASRWVDIPPEAHTTADCPTTDPTADPTTEPASEPTDKHDITVGLLSADTNDERRVRDLVKLFDQRFGIRHYGYVDYAKRLVHLRPRPAEPRYWPAVAQALGVPEEDLARDWMHVGYWRNSPDEDWKVKHVEVTVPVDTLLDSVKTNLKVVLADHLDGQWNLAANKPARTVTATPKPPEPTPPESVGLFSEHPDYQGARN
jgi:hypothetical protein